MNASASTPSSNDDRNSNSNATMLLAPSKNSASAAVPLPNSNNMPLLPNEEDRDPSLAGGSEGSEGRSSPLEEEESTAIPVAAAAAAAAQPAISAEEQASIDLARAMMEEEAMASYAVSYEISMDYLRNNSQQFSQEDLAALEAAMEEENEQEELDTSGMSYDMMLRLGEQLGDVKQERWQQVAQQTIDALPTMVYNENDDNEAKNDCDVKCLVCQCQYEQGETLRKLLPCGHVFHADCVDQWLRDKDFCPYCRTSLVAAGEEEG